MRQPVRVLLLAMPQLLRGILEHAVEAHSDCELLKDSRRAFQLLTDQSASPDIVILGLTAAEDATLVPALFTRWPRAQIVTVTPAGEDALLYELKPRQKVLGQMSPAEIVETLHEAVHRSREFPEE